MVIELPFPDASLNPNRKNGHHWAKTKNAKDVALKAGYYATLAVMAKEKTPAIPIPMTVTFIAPDKRKRDLDNLLASGKNYYDGIAKALGIDDSQFEPITLKRGYDKANPRMIVEIG